MRIADYIFFGTIGIAVVAILVSLFAIGHIPIWLTFWWAPLVPVSLIRVFFPKSKITRALEKERAKVSDKHSKVQQQSNI
ncbi:MAG: hypothetical protein WC979_02875 [Candidatus Pacearchaeota archaeon]|jgi:CHASE2 domain-containing sensor protein|nr:hypothetical protein [Clostridia bacterium]